MSNDAERIQRALNMHKRQFLADKYSARFPPQSMTVPPGVEGRLLDAVAEIEASCAIAGETTVRDYLHCPIARPLEEIPLEELRSELEKLTEFLFEHHIVVLFLGEVVDAAAYQFLSVELMDLMIENVRFPVWYTVFMYHPLLGVKRVGISMNTQTSGRGEVG
jgi:hypothetical protein